MKLVASLIALAFAASTIAADPTYKLDLGASVEAGSLKVEPQVSGPGKSSNSSQGGTVKLDENGRAQLASNSVSVSANDRYVVIVRLLDAGHVVAEKSQQYP
jgi:hypothetical protein